MRHLVACLVLLAVVEGFVPPPGRVRRPMALRFYKRQRSEVDKTELTESKGFSTGNFSLPAIQEKWQAATEFLQQPFNITLPFNITITYDPTFLRGFGLGVIIAYSSLVAAIVFFTTGSSLSGYTSLFGQILTDIDTAYVEKVDPKVLTETAISAMLRTLDPYTEYENNQAARDMLEAVSGKYGGVGLVISGDREPSSSSEMLITNDPEAEMKRQAELGAKRSRGLITVVDAFEGYAFDSGLRIGDRIVSVNEEPVAGKSVEQVRDLLRGPPDTTVKIKYQRGPIDQSQSLPILEASLKRRIVRVNNVKLTTITNGDIGYIRLTSCNQGAGEEVGAAIRFLTRKGTKGLILDLRGNPGGLLDSAVSIASLLVPEGSEIVRTGGRAVPDVIYRSNTSPLRPLDLPLAVLVDDQSASAAEIIAGAVQDLDAGVVIGAGDGFTYGKGLVQTVEQLPMDTAIKFTVARYYTPSGRCIQNFNYKEGSRASGDKYTAIRIPENEQKIFNTQNGRPVKDAAGIEADVKVPAVKSTPLLLSLLQQGAFFDFATEWTSNHKLVDNNAKNNWDEFVTEGTLNEFKSYIQRRESQGTLSLEAIYDRELQKLKEAVKTTGLTSVDNDIEKLKERLSNAILKEFDESKDVIREQLRLTILSRYLPDSLLFRQSLKTDNQVKEAVDVLHSPDRYNKILSGPQMGPEQVATRSDTTSAAG